MEEEKKEKGFVIKDRRLFDETGEARQEAEMENKVVDAEPAGTDQQQSAAKEPSSEDEMDSYLPDVNFGNFILSLSTTAMFHFGDFPDPVSGKAKQNLAAAKHTIDTIGMLETKTKGNLDSSEKTLIDTVLFELRMRYVKESSAPIISKS